MRIKPLYYISRLSTALILLLVLLIFLPAYLLADEPSKPSVLLSTVSNLQELAQHARDQHLPIVLVYAAEDCEHCEQLERDVLEPLLLSGELKNNVILRKFMIDAIESITDFSGKEQDAEYYSIMRDVEVTPTIEFVDANGTQLVPPMVGYQGIEMYLSYFNAAIKASKLIITAQQPN